MRRLLFATMPETTLADALGLAALRVFSGLAMALAHGMGKVPPKAGFIGGVEAMGFPLPTVFAWGAGLAELVGGLLLALGLCTRPAALAIAGTMVVAAFVRHGGQPFATMELALLYLAVVLVFAVRGGGRLSLDHLLTRPKAG